MLKLQWYFWPMFMNLESPCSVAFLVVMIAVRNRPVWCPINLSHLALACAM